MLCRLNLEPVIFSRCKAHKSRSRSPLSFLLPDECGPRTYSYPHLSDPRVAFNNNDVMSRKGSNEVCEGVVELVLAGIDVAVGGCIAGDHLQTAMVVLDGGSEQSRRALARIQKLPVQNDQFLPVYFLSLPL